MSATTQSTNAKRRLVAALDGFVRQRHLSVRSQRHIVPLVEFATAELRARGVVNASMEHNLYMGRFYKRQADLLVKRDGAAPIVLLVQTQAGSVRRNLHNRMRDIVGDCVNIRATFPDVRIAAIYLLKADEEAKRKARFGTSPIDELCAFLADVQTVSPKLLDAAALIAADQDSSGRICIEEVPKPVDVLGDFFDKLTQR